MARTHHVKKCRKEQGNCSTCRKPIEKGSAYRFKNRRNGPGSRSWKVKVHAGCAFRATDLSNSRMAEVADAITDAESAIWNCVDGDSLKATLEDVAGIAQEIGEAAQESLDNMPEQLQEGETGQMLQERAENLDTYQDELSSWEPDEREDDDSAANDEQWLDQLRESASETLNQHDLDL